MKRTQRKDALKNIRKQIVSFLSIIFIAAMAVCAYLGMGFASKSIAAQSNAFYDAVAYRDAEVISTQLLAQEDLNALRNIEGVADLEPMWQSGGMLWSGNEKNAVTVVSLTERINVPLLTAGRLPLAEDECAVDWEIAEKLSLSVGDSVRLTDTTYMRVENFTVCGFMISPDYACMEYAVTGDRTVVVMPAAFDLEALGNCAMKALLRYTDCMGLDRFHKGFIEALDPVSQQIKDLSVQLAPLRTASIREQYGQQITEGEQQLSDAEAQLEDARKQLDDGWAELSEGEAQAGEGKAQLDDARAQLTDALQQLTDGELQLTDGRSQLNAAKAQLDDALAQLTDGQAQLEEAETRLTDGRAQLDDGWAEYHENEALLADAKRQLDEGKTQLEDGRRQLEEAKTQLDEAKAQLEEGEAQYLDAGRQLEEGRKEIDEGDRALDRGRNQLYAGWERLEEGKETARAEMRSMLAYVIGDDTASSIHWSDRRPVDFEIYSVRANDFPITDDPACTLDLNLSLTENIAVLLSGIMEDYGISEEEIRQNIETNFGALLPLPEESIVLAAVRTLTEFIPEYDTYNDAYELLADGARQWDDGYAQLFDGKNQMYWGSEAYLKGSSQYADARAQLDEGWAQYNDGLAQYEAGLAEFTEKEAEYNDGLAQYESGAAQLADGLKQLEDGEADYAAGLAEYEAAKTTLEDGWAQYESGFAQYTSALALFNAKSAEYAEGLARYEDGLAQYETGSEEYEKGLAELEDGKAALEDGEAQYAKGMAEYLQGQLTLSDAKAQLDGLGECRWVLLDINGNASYQILKNAVKNISDLGITFALIFIIVGALVIYATLGRIVEEQRRLVGATKALGLYNREILIKYLVFGVSATLLGILLGIVLAYIMVQPILTENYGQFYNFDCSGKAFHVGKTCIVLLGGIVLSVLAVWTACTDLLRSTATSLLQEKSPSVRQSSRLAKRLSLYTRLILLNIRTDKKRVAVTLAGVMGCCALLVAGFTMRFTIPESINRQYTDIARYDIKASFTADDMDTALPEAQTELERAGAKTLPVYSASMVFSVGDELGASTLLCGDLDAMQPFYARADAKTGALLPPDADGVWLQLGQSEVYGLKAGDPITLYDSAMQPYEATVAGFFNNYVGMEILMSPESYARIFGASPQMNSLLVLVGDAGVAELSETLRENPAVSALEFNSDTREQNLSLASALDMIALLLTAVAGIMAFFILLNLISMHISQKKKELIIMRVNGFTTREVIAYIAQETIVTTLIGIVLGLIAGIVLGRRICHLMEGGMSHFVTHVQPTALLLAALITAVFSLIINIIALRKVKYLKLTDIA